jgi:Zn-dependent protease
VSLTVLGFIFNPWEGSPAPIETFLLMGGFLNLVLFALNMLPVPPLDGSMILANLSTTVARWYTHPQAQMAGLLLFLALIWSNMFGVVFEFARETAMNYAILVFNLVH